MNSADCLEKKTFIYNFDRQTYYTDYPQLHSIGWETRTTQTYKLDCEHSNIRHLLFQYTLRGEGMLTVHNTTYHIGPGEAFLIEKPGPYRYWLSENSKCWDFIFISFTPESDPYWDRIINMSGHIAYIPNKSKIINLWKKIYTATLDNKLTSFYQASIFAYQFLLELTEYFDNKSLAQNQKTCVQKVLQEIHLHYAKPLTVESLAGMCDVSTSHLSFLFRSQIGEPIGVYLRNYRLRQACILLQRSNLSIIEIAKRVGYEDPNFFSRVFKLYKRVTPSDYRKFSSIESEGFDVFSQVENEQ